MVDISSIEKGDDLYSEKHFDVEATSLTEKPKKAILLPPVPPPPDSGVGWVPQIKTLRVQNVAIPEPIRKSTSRSNDIWEKSPCTVPPLSLKMNRHVHHPSTS